MRVGLRDVGLLVGLLVTGDVSGFVVVGGAVGVPYLTVISCGAAQVPPKYNPSTDPCS